MYFHYDLFCFFLVDLSGHKERSLWAGCLNLNGLISEGARTVRIFRRAGGEGSIGPKFVVSAE